MTKRIFFLCILISPLLQGSVYAQLYELFHPHRYQSNAGALQYRLMTPAKPDSGQVYPLVIFLHGAGERGDDNQKQLYHVMPRFATTKMRIDHPAYVLAPQCPEGEQWISGNYAPKGKSLWHATPSTKQIVLMEIVDNLIQNASVDPDRIYVCGLSMGGAGTWSLLAQYPDRFAAAIPVCGWTNPEDAERIAHIPIWAFHGADDGVVPPSQSRAMIDALRKVGSHPIYTEFEGVRHDSWVPAFSEQPLIYDWLFSHKRKTR